MLYKWLRTYTKPVPSFFCEKLGVACNLILIKFEMSQKHLVSEVLPGLLYSNAVFSFLALIKRNCFVFFFLINCCIFCSFPCLLSLYFVADSEGKLKKEIDNEGSDLDKTKFFYKTPEESKFWSFVENYDEQTFILAFTPGPVHGFLICLFLFCFAPVNLLMCFFF